MHERYGLYHNLHSYPVMRYYLNRKVHLHRMKQNPLHFCIRDTLLLYRPDREWNEYYFSQAGRLQFLHGFSDCQQALHHDTENSLSDFRHWLHGSLQTEFHHYSRLYHLNWLTECFLYIQIFSRFFKRYRNDITIVKLYSRWKTEHLPF